MERLTRIIKAVAIRNKSEGEIGFLVEEGDLQIYPKGERWLNVRAPVDALDMLLKDIIKKGNIVEFELDNGFAKNFVLKEKGSHQSQNKSEKNWADDMTNYEDLLKAAHKKSEKDGYILNMESKPLVDGQGNPLVDFDKKRALYEATLLITDKDGKIIQRITDTGDAEGITNEKIAIHFNRMASTRAMARCYRIYTNNAKVAVEETEQKDVPGKADLRSYILNILKGNQDQEFKIETLPGIKDKEEANLAVRDLLEEGLIFEPRPGYIKYLG